MSERRNTICERFLLCLGGKTDTVAEKHCLPLPSALCIAGFSIGAEQLKEHQGVELPADAGNSRQAGGGGGRKSADT